MKGEAVKNSTGEVIGYSYGFRMDELSCAELRVSDAPRKTAIADLVGVRQSFTDRAYINFKFLGQAGSQIESFFMEK